MHYQHQRQQSANNSRSLSPRSVNHQHLAATAPSTTILNFYEEPGPSNQVDLFNTAASANRQEQKQPPQQPSLPHQTRSNNLKSSMVATPSSRPQTSSSSTSRIQQIVVAPTAIDRHIQSLPSDEEQNPYRSHPWWQRAVLDKGFRKHLVSYISSAHRMLDEYASSIPQPWDLPAPDRGKSVEGKKFELNFSNADKDADGNIRTITRVKSATYYREMMNSSPSLYNRTQQHQHNQQQQQQRPGTSAFAPRTFLTASAAATRSTSASSSSAIRAPSFSTFSKISLGELALQNSIIKNTHKDIALARGTWIPYSVLNRAPGDGPSYRWMGDFPPCGFHISFTNITGDLEQVHEGVLKPPSVPSFETIGTPECPASKALYATRPQYPLLGGIVVPKDIFCVYLVSESTLKKYPVGVSLIGDNNTSTAASSPDRNERKTQAKNRYASQLSMQRQQVQHVRQSNSGGVNSQLQTNHHGFTLDDPVLNRALNGNNTSNPAAAAATTKNHQTIENEKDLIRFTSIGGARYQLIDREDTSNLIVIGQQKQHSSIENVNDETATNNNGKKKKKPLWNVPIISAEEEEKKKKAEKKLFGIFSVEEMKKFRAEQEHERLRKELRANRRRAEGLPSDEDDNEDQQNETSDQQQPTKLANAKKTNITSEHSNSNNNDDSDGEGDGDNSNDSDDDESNDDGHNKKKKKLTAEEKRREKYKSLLPTGSTGFAFGPPKFLAYLWPSQRLMRFRLLSAALLRIAHDEKSQDLARGFNLPDDPLASYLRPDLTDSRIEFLFSSEPCRESVQRIFDLLPKDPHNRLEMSGFVGFTLDLFNLYMPLYSDKANLLLAEAEWAARGIQDDSLDFLLFYWFFFDFPLFVMRDGFIREIDYVRFWEFTYEQIFVNEIHSCCDFEQVVTLRDIEHQLHGRVPESRLAYRAHVELQMRKTKVKNQEKRSQLLIEEKKQQALLRHEQHQREQEKQNNSNKNNEKRDDNNDDATLRAQDLDQELHEQQEAQRMALHRALHPEMNNRKNSPSHHHNNNNNTSSPSALSRSAAALKRAEEANFQQMSGFREYIDRFNQDGTSRRDDLMMTQQKQRQSHQKRRRMKRTLKSINDKKKDNEDDDSKRLGDDGDVSEDLQRVDSFKLMLSYEKDDPRRYKTSTKLAEEKSSHHRRRRRRAATSTNDNDDDDYLEDHNFEDDYEEEESEDDLENDENENTMRLLKNISPSALAYKRQQDEELRKQKSRLRPNRRALALLKGDQDAPENHVEALLDFVDDMSDSDLEETDHRGRLVVFDRFRLSREIRRRRDHDDNRRSDGMPTRLAARTLILDRRREREIMRQEVAASRISAGEDEETVLREMEEDRKQDRMREQEEFQFGAFAKNGEDEELEDEEEEHQEEENADKNEHQENDNNEQQIQQDEARDLTSEKDQDHQQKKSQQQHQQARSARSSKPRRRHTLLGVQDEQALREELKKMTHDAENEEINQEEAEDMAAAARRRRQVARMLAVRRQERARLQELAQSASQMKKVNRYTMFGAPMLKMPGDSSSIETSRTPRQIIKPVLETHRIHSPNASSTTLSKSITNNNNNKLNGRGEMALPIVGGNATSRIYTGAGGGISQRQQQTQQQQHSHQVPLSHTNKVTNMPTTTFSRTCAGSAGASEAHVRAAMLQSGFALPLTVNSERARLRTQQLGRSRRLEFGNNNSGSLIGSRSGSFASFSPSSRSASLLMESGGAQVPSNNNNNNNNNNGKKRPHTTGGYANVDLHSLISPRQQQLDLLQEKQQQLDQEREKRKRRQEAVEFIFGTGTFEDFDEEKKKKNRPKADDKHDDDYDGNDGNDHDVKNSIIDENHSRSATPKWVEFTENEAIILERDRREMHSMLENEMMNNNQPCGGGSSLEKFDGSRPRQRRSPKTGELIPQLSVPDSKLGDTLEDQRLHQQVILPLASSLNKAEMERRIAAQKEKKHQSPFDFESVNNIGASAGHHHYQPHPPQHARFSMATTTTVSSTARRQSSSQIERRQRPATTSSTTCRPLMQSLQAPSSRERANPHPSSSHPDIQFARWLTALQRTAQSSTSRVPFGDEQRSEF